MMINKNYTLLLTAYLLSSVGDWLYRLALPLLILKLTGSPFDMAVAYGMTFLPFVLVTPFGGVIADRLDKKKILVCSDLAAFVFTVIFAIVASTTQHIWLLYLLVFIIASFSSFAHPVFQSILPVIVSREKLAKANSLISTIDNVLTLLGPLCGGIIITLIGSLDAIYLNAFSFILSAILIAIIVAKHQPVSESSRKMSVMSVLHDLKEGFDYVWKHNPVIKYGCLLFVFTNFGVQFFYANFMFYLAHFLHLNPVQIGLTLGLSGIGAILGSLIAPYIANYVAPGRLIVLSCLLEGIMTLILLGAHGPVYVIIVWGIASAFASITIVTYFTLRQEVVPANVLGRTVAITRLISYSSIPIASIVGGWFLGVTYNMYYIILIGGGIMTVNGLLGLLSPLNRNITEPKVKEMAV